MTTLTQQQLEELKGKCPECWNIISDSCKLCLSTGKATIKIEKEWVECPDCKGYVYNTHCRGCNGKGTIPKFKVGDEIEITIGDKQKNGKVILRIFKLKILSESEDKYKIVMVR